MRSRMHQIKSYLIVVSLIFLLSSLLVNTSRSHTIDMEINPDECGYLVFGTSGTITLIAFESNANPFSLLIIPYTPLGNLTEICNQNESVISMYDFDHISSLHENVNFGYPGVFLLVCSSNENVTLSMIIEIINDHISVALLTYSLFPIIGFIICLIINRKSGDDPP